MRFKPWLTVITPRTMASLELLIALFVLATVAVSSEWGERDSGMTSSGNRPVYMVTDGGEMTDNRRRNKETISDSEGEYKADGLISSGYKVDKLISSGNTADGLPFKQQESFTNVMPAPPRSSFLSLASQTHDSCIDFSSGLQAQVQSVVLLRTSCQYLVDNFADTPLTFNVDSTILTIVIEVKGAKALDATIWDSGGAMINKRLKRSVEYPQKDTIQTGSTSSRLSQLTKYPKSEIVNLSEQLFSTQQSPSLENQGKQHNKKVNLAKWIQQVQDQIRQRREQERFINQNLQEMYNTHSEDKLNYQNDYNSPSRFKKQPRNHQHEKDDQKKQFRLSPTTTEYGNLLLMPSSFSLIDMHETHSRLKPKATDFETRLENMQNTIPQFHPKPFEQSGQKLSVFFLNQSQTYSKSGEVGYPESLEQQHLHNGTPDIALPYHMNNKSTFRRQDSQHKVYNNHRHKRSSRLISMQMSAGAAVWEIEPQATGEWTITVDGTDPVQVEVTAKSSLDFSFELLGNATLSNVTSQPLANEPTIARVTFTSLACVYNVTMMSLYDVAGKVVAKLELAGSGLYRLDMDHPNTILINFQMPFVPFYMSISGYDITGNKFQRLSSVCVVPRMFTLSLVTSSPGPLVPGNDYIFEVRLRNYDRPETFNFVVECDNLFCLQASVYPETLQVSQIQTSQLKVTVRIHPSISDITNGTLTVAALRVSDNMTEILSFEVTAEPKSFREDHTAPICTTEWTSGGCRPDAPCESQEWAVSLSVTDNLTGVRSVQFIDPPDDSFNEIQFSPTNKTARANYRYICCNAEATLLAYDYANNPSTCKIFATSLDSASTPSPPPETESTDINSPTIGLRASSSASSVTPETPSNSVTINKSQNPWTSIPSDKFHSSITPTSFTTRKHTRRRHNTTADGNVPTTRGSNEGNYTHKRSPSTSSQSGWKYTPVSTSTPSTGLTFTLFNNLTSVSNSSAPFVKNDQRQSPTNSARSNALRIAATVCASVGGAAGLTICVLCFIHKITKVQEQRRGIRRPRNGSDVTMGSSSESRHDGNSEVGSVRLTKTKSRNDSGISTSAFYKNSKQSQRANDHTSDTVKGCKNQTRNSRVGDSEKGGKDYAHQLEFKKVVYTARGRGQIEEKMSIGDNKDILGKGERFLEEHGKVIFNSTCTVREETTNMCKHQVGAQVEKTKKHKDDRVVTGTRRGNTSEGMAIAGTPCVDTAEGKNVVETRRVDTAERKNIVETRSFDTVERKNIVETRSVDTGERKNIVETPRVDTAERKNIVETRSVDTAERKNIVETRRVDTADRKNITETGLVDTAKQLNTLTKHCLETGQELPNTPGINRHEIGKIRNNGLSIDASYDLSAPGAPHSKLDHIESQYKRTVGSSYPRILYHDGNGTSATHIHHRHEDGHTTSGTWPDIFTMKNSSLFPLVEAQGLHVKLPVTQCLCQDVRDHVNSVAVQRNNDFRQGSQVFERFNFNTTPSISKVEPFSFDSCCHGISQNCKRGVVCYCQALAGKENNNNASITTTNSRLNALPPSYSATTMPMKLVDNGRYRFTGLPGNTQGQGIAVQGSKSDIERQVHNRHVRVLRGKRSKTNGAVTGTWQHTFHQHPADGLSQCRSLQPHQSWVRINGQEKVTPGAVKQTKYDENVCVRQQPFNIAVPSIGHPSDTYFFTGINQQTESRRKGTPFGTKSSLLHSQLVNCDIRMIRNEQKALGCWPYQTED